MTNKTALEALKHPDIIIICDELDKHNPGVDNPVWDAIDRIEQSLTAPVEVPDLKEMLSRMDEIDKAIVESVQDDDILNMCDSFYANFSDLIRSIASQSHLKTDTSKFDLPAKLVHMVRHPEKRHLTRVTIHNNETGKDEDFYSETVGGDAVDVLEGAVIINRGDGVDGHYCIGRKSSRGEFWEFYNKGKWCSAGQLFYPETVTAVGAVDADMLNAVKKCIYNADKAGALALLDLMMTQKPSAEVTAPKDRAIFLWGGQTLSEIAEKASKNLDGVKGYWELEANYTMEENEDEYTPKGQWQVADTSFYSVEVIEPTHWTPLPRPPEPSSEG